VLNGKWTRVDPVTEIFESSQEKKARESSGRLAVISNQLIDLFRYWSRLSTSPPFNQLWQTKPLQKREDKKVPVL
jgi:hypothetical protein